MLYQNIMVPHDGSPSAQAALKQAAEFARADAGLTLRIVQIIDSEELVVEKLAAEGRTKDSVTSAAELGALYDAALHDANTKLHAQIGDILKGLQSKILIEMIEKTTPGEQIVTYSNDNNCDLIIMGSRGLGALRGMLGSVSSHVLRHATMPVLIVKNQEEN